jgi:HEAT repeat protein
MVGADPKAIQEAESALQDKEPEVRAAAARALGEMHSTGSIAKLAAATHDKDLLVAVSASSALLAMKDKGGYEVFYAVLTGERKGSGMIAQQAKDLKDPKKATQFAFEEGIGFVPFAGGGFEAIRMLTKKDPSPLRAAAAAALADDSDPDCGKALGTALKDDNWIVRIAVVKAIAKRGDPALLPVVAEAMSDKRDEVRLSAAAAVLRLSATAAPEKKSAQAKMETPR